MPLARSYGGVVFNEEGDYGRGYGGVALSPQTEDTVPFLTGFTKRKPIRYHNELPGSTLTDFPFFMNIVADADIAAEIVSSGGIAITLADGVSRTPFGLYPSTNLASGTVVVRAKFTVLHNAPGSIMGYIYYKDGAVSAEDKAGVVSNGYTTFMPLEEDPSGSAPQMYDWVSGTYVGTSAGSMTSGDLVNGQVGKGLDFDGTNDLISLTTNTPTTITIEAWVNYNNALGGTNKLAIDMSAGGGTQRIILWADLNKWFMRDASSDIIESTAGISPGVLQYLALKFSGTTSTSYADGVQVDTDTNASFGLGALTSVILGQTGTNAFGGIIDEFRITSLARSTDWIAFTYENEGFNAGTFQLGDEEEAPAVPFLSGYYKRKPIRYGSYTPTENLTGFPILFTISGDSDIAAEVATGIDITTADGLSTVPFGLYPSTNIATGDILVRAKFDLNSLVDAGDILGYIYYKNGQVSNERKTETVANGYVFFCPMEEDPSGASPQMYDWVSETKKGISTGSMTSGDSVTGKVGKAIDFDGINDSIYCALSLTPTTATVEVALNYNSSVGVGSKHALDFIGAASVPRIILRAVDNDWFIRDAGSDLLSVAAGISAGSWKAYAVTINGTVSRSYGNGSFIAQTTNASYGAAALNDIGLSLSGAEYGGLMDEVRISSVARSAGWLAFAYHNDFNNSTTFSLGSEETTSEPSFLAGYSKRKAIYYGSIVPLNTNLALRIPGHIKLINIDGDSDIAAELASGGGIAFTKADGTSQVPFGLYSVTDVDSGDILARVQYTLEVNANPGDLMGYIYYDSSASTTENKTGVAGEYTLFMPLDDAPVELEDSLVDWWEMNGSSATTETGVLGIIMAAGTVPAAISGWRDFELSSSQFLIGADSDSASTADIGFHIHAEVQLESLSNGGIFTKAESNTNREFQLRANSTGTFRFHVYNSSGTDIAVAESAVCTTGVTYIIDAWHDPVANTANIQIDGGTIVSAATTGVPVNTTSSLRMGLTQGSGSFFDGLIRRVGYWKRILTTGEKTALAGGTSPTFANTYTQTSWTTNTKVGRTFGNMTPSDVVAGQFGNALAFDGDDVVSISPALVTNYQSNPDANVLSCWYKSSTTKLATLADFARSGSGLNGLWLGVANTTDFAKATALGSDFGNDTADGTTDVINNAWHKLELVWLAGEATVAVFVDGVQQDTEVTPTLLHDFIMQAAKTMQIGGSISTSTFGDYANGTIQHVMYNRLRNRANKDVIYYAYREEADNANSFYLGIEEDSGGGTTPVSSAQEFNIDYLLYLVNSKVLNVEYINRITKDNVITVENLLAILSSREFATETGTLIRSAQVLAVDYLAQLAVAQEFNYDHILPATFYREMAVDYLMGVLSQQELVYEHLGAGYAIGVNSIFNVEHLAETIVDQVFNYDHILRLAATSREFNIENLLGVAASAELPISHTMGLAVDQEFALDYLMGTGLYDKVFALEYLGRIASDQVFAYEYGSDFAGIIMQAMFNIEHLLELEVAQEFVSENLISTLHSKQFNVENLLEIERASVLPIDHILNLSMSKQFNVDYTLRTVQAQIFAYEILSAVRAGKQFNVEYMLNFLKAVTLPVDYQLRVAKDSTFPIAYESRINLPQAFNIEHLRRMVFNGQMPYDYIGQFSKPFVFNVDYTISVTNVFNQIFAIDYLLSTTNPRQFNVEYIQSLLTTKTLAYDYLGSLGISQELAIESLLALQSQHIFAVEWGISDIPDTTPSFTWNLEPRNRIWVLDSRGLVWSFNERSKSWEMSPRTTAWTFSSRNRNLRG